MAALRRSWLSLKQALQLVWLPIVLSWGIAGFVVLVTLALLALFGGLRTSGSSLDWTAVAAVASVITMLATVALGAGLVISASQIEEQRRQAASEQRRATDDQRDSRLPVLRVDIGFADWRNEPGFRYPSGHIYDLSQLDRNFDPYVVAPIAGAPEIPGSHPLVVWCTNRQTHQRGHAGRIHLSFEIQWTVANEDPAGTEIAIDLAYLAPGQTTAVRLCWVRPGLETLVVRLGTLDGDVEYFDVRQRQRLTDVYGALGFVYDGSTVQNVRELRSDEVG